MLKFDEKKRSTYKELLQEFYPETISPMDNKIANNTNNSGSSGD